MGYPLQYECGQRLCSRPGDDAWGASAAVLQAAGVDGLLFCNEKDYPYQLKVGVEIPSAMAAAIGRLRSAIRVPFGVNILWDPIASLALARATGRANALGAFLDALTKAGVPVTDPATVAQLRETAGLPKVGTDAEEAG